MQGRARRIPHALAGAALLLALAAGPAPARTRARLGNFRALHASAEVRVHRVDTRGEVRVFEADAAVPDAFLAAFRRALDELEVVLGPVDAPIRVHVGGPSRSLAVAYNPAEDAVLFPRHKRAENFGLADHDRLRHELLHAYLGRTHPHLVTPEALRSEELRTVHEGAADFFASLADDNGTFGDRYLPGGGGTLRTYRTDLRYPLVLGSHARGNTLTAYWLREGHTLADVTSRITAGCEEVACMVDGDDHEAFGLGDRAPDLLLEMEGHPPSVRQRYRVGDGDVLALRVNDAFLTELGEPSYRMVTTSNSPVPGWTFEPLGGVGGLRRFRVVPDPGADPAKVVVRIRAGGRLVGFDVLYLGRRRGH